MAVISASVESIFNATEMYLSGVYDELNGYIETLDSEWIFPSRKGDGHINRIQADKQLNKAAEMVDMPDGLGTHTMRKNVRLL